MGHKIVITSNDWADEFTIQGFMVAPAKEIEEKLELVKSAEYPMELGFGTNEWIDVRSADEALEDNWCNKFKVVDITDEEAHLLSRLFDDGVADDEEVSFEYGHCRLQMIYEHIG